jgi:hypothetical protein
MVCKLKIEEVATLLRITMSDLSEAVVMPPPTVSYPKSNLATFIDSIKHQQRAIQ